LQYNNAICQYKSKSSSFRANFYKPYENIASHWAEIKSTMKEKENAKDRVQFFDWSCSKKYFLQAWQYVQILIATYPFIICKHKNNILFFGGVSLFLSKCF